MFTREESSRIRQEFWTRFGQYMKPVPSASGEKVNWSNYRTGLPHIFFRMTVERKYASIAILLTNPSMELREQQYAILESMKMMLHEQLGETWDWQRNSTDENGRTLSCISTRLEDVSIYRESDWPSIISFLKPRIMALDNFWYEVKEIMPGTI